MSDGGILILFLVVLFFLWLLIGGPSHSNVNDPFLKVNTQQIQTQ